MLDDHEAVTLAGLLEALAAHHPSDPLSEPARRQAALLRQRVAARPEPAIRSVREDRQTRLEAGGDRDEAADRRDAGAGVRDRRAGGRDDQARRRRQEADAADHEARASEQQVRDLLRNAELRDEAAGSRAAAGPPADDGARRQQQELDQEMTDTDRTHGAQDRETIRAALSQFRAGWKVVAHGRGADAQDRLASYRDRQSAYGDRHDADRDRQAARADRDQAVIDSEADDRIAGELSPPDGGSAR